MQRKVISITLLLMVLFSVTVFGFTDVSETDWFYNDVTALKEQSVIAGYQDGTFKPQNNITNGESLKMIMSVANIEVESSIPGTHWASNYHLKALEKSIVADKNMDLNTLITRQAVADIVVNALELDSEGLEVKSINFKDIDNRNINILVGEGIINGIPQADGLYFMPDKLITRAEMSAILVRVQKHKLGLLETPEVPEVPDIVEEETENEVSNILENGLYKAISDEEVNYASEPTEAKELEKVLLYMSSNGILEHTVKYKTIGINDVRDKSVYKEEVSKAFSNVFAKYPEYFSFTNQLAYKMSGTDSYVNITFQLRNPNFTNKQVSEMFEVFINDTTKQVVEFIEEGKITNEMTEREKARFLYDWVILNTEYDYTFQSESFTGFGQITTGKAVCQGYTATYNYMCKLVGLDVYGITGQSGIGGKKEEHIWTIAVLDGEKVHIDSTWGDSGNSKPINSYFGASTEYMRKTHTWETEKFGI